MSHILGKKLHNLNIKKGTKLYVKLNVMKFGNFKVLKSSIIAITWISLFLASLWMQDSQQTEYCLFFQLQISSVTTVPTQAPGIDTQVNRLKNRV